MTNVIPSLCPSVLRRKDCPFARKQKQQQISSNVSDFIRFWWVSGRLCRDGAPQGISTIVFACATFILAFAAPRASDQQAVLSLGYLVYGSGRVSLSTNCQTRRSKTQINLTSFIQPLLIYSMLFSNIGKRLGTHNIMGYLSEAACFLLVASGYSILKGKKEQNATEITTYHSHSTVLHT